MGDVKAISLVLYSERVYQEEKIFLSFMVARLQEELQKERDKRKALEAGLNTSQGPLLVPATIDEKTKAEIEEIAQAEADVINLKQKVDDLGMQLNQQREQNYGSAHDSCNQPQQTSKYPEKLKVKQDTEDTATSHLLERSTSKDTYLDGAETENENKQESTSLPNKHPPQNQLLDPVHNRKSRSVNSSATEPVAPRPTASTSSKRSGTRGEGANGTTSALTKLTTRLNFLKERRSQIANELQNMDKGRGSGQAGPITDKGRGSEPLQLQNLDKGKGSEIQSVTNPEKSRGLVSGHSLQNPDKEVGTEGQSLQNSERFRKSDSHSSTQILNEEIRSKSQHPLILDRGRSEGHVPYNADKGRGFGGPPLFPPRTNSR